MITYKYIEKNTIYVVKTSYERRSGTIEELAGSKHMLDSDMCSKQPDPELQRFWDSYYKFGQEYRFCMNSKEFYDHIYSRSPEAFEPKTDYRETITTLSAVLEGLADKTDIMVEHCGNHWAESWRRAIEELGRDFDVVRIEKHSGTMRYTVRGTEEELRKLSSSSNQASIDMSMARLRA